MAEVINLHGAPSDGDLTFVQCPCNPQQPAPLLPIVCHDAQGSFVAALVCPECEATTPVAYGRLQPPVEG